MTIEQLKAQLGNSDFVIIDVRTAHDWQDSGTKIKGDVRVSVIFPRNLG